MVDLTNPQDQVLLFIPAAGLLLWYLSKGEQSEQTQSVILIAEPKETGFLRFNQDGIYSNLLATEEHFRVQAADANTPGFSQCEVKHLSLAGNHASEAVSHAVATGNRKSAASYSVIMQEISSLREDIQDNKVKPLDGIERVREIRQRFESFNSDYDVNKCKACAIE